MSISRRSLVGLIAALVLWSALAWLTDTVNAGAHVCSILGLPEQTTDANGQTRALTQAEMDKWVRERCDRPPSPVAILVFGTGYVVIIAVFVGRADRRSEGSSDDPLVPSR